MTASDGGTRRLAPTPAPRGHRPSRPGETFLPGRATRSRATGRARRGRAERRR